MLKTDQTINLMILFSGRELKYKLHKTHIAAKYVRIFD